VSALDTALAVGGLHGSEPHPLPFGRDLEIRAFVLERPAGDVLLHSVPDVHPGTVVRHYLGHGHEALFAPSAPVAPVFVHEADAAAVETALHVRATFSRRHALDGDLEVIPIPGHTPGSTAFLWETGGLRVLFTADSLYLRGEEWVAAVLASSDRGAYLQSLELLRGLEFDVLVPWVATRGGPWLAVTHPADARRRLDAILRRVERGGSS
jgi:glyoxylase-like metal-dependent hydrolase (beta-lactamase superfamily II)